MKSIVLIILFVCTNPTLAQIQIEKQIDRYTETVLKMLKKDFNNRLHGYDLDSFEIRVIPSFYYYVDKEHKGQYELNSYEWELLGKSKNSKDTIWFNADKIGKEGIVWNTFSIQNFR
jgi:hypothetical protein